MSVGKLRAVTYSRVSTSHHDQRPEVQVDELRRYCSARGFEIIREVVDHGYSGGTDASARPGLKELLELVRLRQVDVVVVLKLDRLFRSLKHLLVSLEEFQAVGVQFIAVKDAVDYTTPQGRLFVQVLGCLGEFEKALLRERTLLGLDHARRRGKRLGRPRQHDDEAIRRLRGEGLSYREIARRLKAPMGTITRALRAAHKTPGIRASAGLRRSAG